MRSPEPIIDNRRIDIYRLNHIVGTIDVLIANNLHRHLFGCFISLHIYASNVLIDVLSQYGLDNDQVCIFVGSFNHTEVIYYSIAVKVEIRDTRLGVIELLFELFQVFGFSKKRSNCFQI